MLGSYWRVFTVLHFAGKGEEWLWSFLLVFFLFGSLFKRYYIHTPSYLAKLTFQYFVYMKMANSSLWARQLGEARCLITSVNRVTLASGTTFPMSTLAHLSETTHGVPSVTKNLDFRFQSTDLTKCRSAKPTIIVWAKETQKKKDKWGFEYFLFISLFGVICNHQGSTLIRPAGTTFSLCKPSIKFFRGEGCLGYRYHVNEGPDAEHELWSWETTPYPYPYLSKTDTVRNGSNLAPTVCLREV